MSPAGDAVRTVGELSLRDFAARLSGDGLGVRVGCFAVYVQARVSGLADPLYRLYRDYELLEGSRVYSFHLRLTERRGPALKRLVRFSVDGRTPHEDLPAAQALAVLEWGLNLVIALRMHAFLMLHAAAAERNDALMLLPAGPGHGKTTLCAGLVNRGWRLFSDEFGLVRPGEIRFIPLPRPMPLKNESIDVMRAFAPAAGFGPTIPNTRKGTVSHMLPPTDSVRQADRHSQPRWVVFPRWLRGEPLRLEPLPKAEAFMSLAINAFNYEMLGELAFSTLRDTIEASRCFRMTYSDLEEAVAALTRLADDDARIEIDAG